MESYKNGGLRVLYNQSEQYFNMPEPHFHAEYELYYLISGTRLFFINGKVYPMVPGCLAFVDGGHMHRAFSKSDEPHTRLVLCFDKHRMSRTMGETAEMFERGGCVALSPKEQKNFEQIMSQIAVECAANRPQKHRYVALLAEQLLLLAYRRYLKPSPEISYGGADVLKALKYIDQNFRARITLADLCAYLGVSVSHLTRMFKSSTGYTLTEYINNLRIKTAAEMLISTDLPVSDIALETGFHSFSYFGKIFAECYGVPPLKYRKAARL